MKNSAKIVREANGLNEDGHREMAGKVWFTLHATSDELLDRIVNILRERWAEENTFCGGDSDEY